MEGEDWICATLLLLATTMGPSIKKGRNWVFAQNSDFLIPITFQPVFRDLWYFKLLILLDQIVSVWNIKGLHNQVAKI